ncbi:MAG: LPXTG cell wall anchor domain-containing protein [Acidimicrobiales bacterium]
MRTWAYILLIPLALALGACSGDDGNGAATDSRSTPPASEPGGSNDPADPASASDGEAEADADADSGAPQDEEASADDGEPLLRAAGKVTICHRTESESNPFVAITIAENAIGGHLNHAEDVIPPTESQPGQNWPSDIVDENCNPLEPTPEPTATPEPTPEPTQPPIDPMPTSTEPPVEPTPEPTQPPIDPMPTPEPTEPPIGPPVEPTPEPTLAPTPSVTPPQGGGDGGPTDGSDGELANTGAYSGRLAVIAGFLLAIGAALIFGSRRRESRAH